MGSVKVWEFPASRFVEYTPADEWWCRKYGLGREVTRQVVYSVPRAVITGVSPDGAVTFRPLPDYSL